jgi:hypothetical protein
MLSQTYIALLTAVELEGGNAPPASGSDTVAENSWPDRTACWTFQKNFSATTLEYLGTSATTKPIASV